MSSISKKTTLAELGAIICEAFKLKEIDAVLSGGAVVSIYTHNRYQSFDLDFISLADRRKIKRIMEHLGFTQNRGRLFIHPKSQFSVEFPGAAIQIGDSLITHANELKLSTGTLKLLTPTDCVKDRLAAFYHWNDRQALDQAIWVTLAQPVHLSEVKHWSQAERKINKYKEFEKALKLQVRNRI